MFTTDLAMPITTAELQAIQTLLQNETAWDRDADTGGFNAYHSADNHTRPGSGVDTSPRGSRVEGAQFGLAPHRHRAGAAQATAGEV